MLPEEPPLGQDVSRIHVANMAKGGVTETGGQGSLALGDDLDARGIQSSQPTGLADSIELGKGKLPRPGKLRDDQLDHLRWFFQLLPVLEEKALRLLEEGGSGIDGRADDGDGRFSGWAKTLGRRVAMRAQPLRYHGAGYRFSSKYCVPIRRTVPGHLGYGNLLYGGKRLGEARGVNAVGNGEILTSWANPHSPAPIRRERGSTEAAICSPFTHP